MRRAGWFVARPFRGCLCVPCSPLRFSASALLQLPSRKRTALERTLSNKTSCSSIIIIRIRVSSPCCVLGCLGPFIPHRRATAAAAVWRHSPLCHRAPAAVAHYRTCFLGTREARHQIASGTSLSHSAVSNSKCPSPGMIRMLALRMHAVALALSCDTDVKLSRSPTMNSFGTCWASETAQ